MPDRLFTERPKWAPDGRAILFTTGGTRVYVLDLIDGSVRFLTYGQDPEWSPDGTQVAFVRLGRATEIGIVRSDGSSRQATVVARTEEGIRGPLAWNSADGLIYFTRGDGAVCTVRLSDGNISSLPIHGPAKDLASSPQGDWIAFTIPGSQPDKRAICAYHIASAEVLFLGESSPCSLYWSERGQSLIAIPLDSRETPLSFRRPDFKLELVHVPKGLAPLVPSPAGRSFLYTAQRAPGELSLGDTGTNRLRVFAHGYFPAWSPDGEQIAFFDSADEESNLCTQRCNGRDFVRWPGTSPKSPVGERASGLALAALAVALFPGLPSLGASAATLPLLELSRWWQAVALTLGWAGLFSAYFPATRWIFRRAHELECPCAGRALALLPPAALATASVHRALLLPGVWILPLLAMTTATCVLAAMLLAQRHRGTYRALAAAWALALLTTSIASAFHSHRQAALRSAQALPTASAVQSDFGPR